MTTHPRNSTPRLSAAALAALLLAACHREPPARSTDTPSANPAHASVALLPADVTARLQPLQARLVENPHDVATHKEIAVILLTHGRFLLAFDHAQEILRADPDDPDGLYVHGVVRVAMGQSQQAIEIFDRLLARHPGHVPALAGRGRAAMKLGDLDGAIASWEKGLAAAGGRHAGLEKLLWQARSARSPMLLKAGAAR